MMIKKLLAMSVVVVVGLSVVGLQQVVDRTARLRIRRV